LLWRELLVKPISHPDTRVKHCAYDHSVATLVNPRGVFPKVATYATVVVAVPSTVHYPANYKLKLYHSGYSLRV
jgi:hypothetical protein